MNQTTVPIEGEESVRPEHLPKVRGFLASTVGVLASAAVSWRALPALVPSYLSAWTDNQKIELEKHSAAIQAALARNDTDKKG